MTANYSGDENIPLLKIATSEVEEKFVRDETTNELYLPLSSLKVLERKKEKLYVPLDFENASTIDDLVDSRDYPSAIAQIELDRMKQQTPLKSSKLTIPPISKIKLRMAS